jgi:hypothetical protein
MNRKHMGVALAGGVILGGVLYVATKKKPAVLIPPLAIVPRPLSPAAVPGAAYKTVLATVTIQTPSGPQKAQVAVPVPTGNVVSAPATTFMATEQPLSTFIPGVATPGKTSLPEVIPPTIRLGSTGPTVVAWQNVMKATLPVNLIADGQFGPETQNATIAWQKKQGLAADGIVGPATWVRAKAIGASLA